MNCSLFTADRMTHIKIVLVALLASIAVVLVATFARPTELATTGVVQIDLSHVTMNNPEPAIIPPNQTRSSI